MPRKALSLPAARVNNNDQPIKNNPFAIAVMVVVLVTATALLVKQSFAQMQAKDLLDAEATSNSDEDMQDIISKVAQHIKIKTDEVPSLATVKDANLLRQTNPNFYQDAENGDRLLIWSDKAVLYSPVKDILLAVMPVIIKMPPQDQSAQAPTNSAQTATENPNIEVRNGSLKKGIGTLIATKLKELQLNVLSPTDAKNRNGYPNSLIIVKPGLELPQTTKLLQTLTNAAIIQGLPENEPAMKGDILLIVGTNIKL